MSLGRLGKGEGIAAVSAILLYALMSFDWFGVVATNENSGSGLLYLFRGSRPGKNAWEALDYISIILLIAIVVAVAVAVLRLVDAIPGSTMGVDAVVALLGVVSALLIAFRILAPPGFGREWILTLEATVESSMFLSLAAAAGIALGGLLAMWEEGRARNLS